MDNNIFKFIQQQQHNNSSTDDIDYAMTQQRLRQYTNDNN